MKNVSIIFFLIICYSLSAQADYPLIEEASKGDLQEVKRRLQEDVQVCSLASYLSRYVL